MTRRCRVSWPLRLFAFVVAAGSSVRGFTTQPLTVQSIPRATTMRRNLMITPDQSMIDLMQSAASMDLSNHAVMVSNSVATTQWLAATDAGDGGWWEAYINVFEIALTLVHSTIVGPLESVGIDQTWGISIAIFTAGTCRGNSKLQNSCRIHVAQLCNFHSS